MIFMKKERNYNGITYSYYLIDNKKDYNTIILPGWQQNYRTYENIYKTISKYSNIYVLDFPGFKNTIEPTKAVDLNYYVYLLNDLIINETIKNIILFGHSFGGRVAIKYQSIFKDTNHLILVSSAGFKNKNIFNTIKIYIYKFKKNMFKKLNKKKYIKLLTERGSKDYKELSPIMKQTFINIINEDIIKHLENINIPTLLLWGKKDNTTPLKFGKIFNKKIKNSVLIKFEKSGHFCFLDEPIKFNLIIDKYYEYIWGDNY